MSVVKRPGRSSVAFVVALTLLLAFVVPFVGTALAGHNTDHDLDCTPETEQNPTGTEHEITCTVSGDPQTNVEVDFEITGANDPDNSDSPTSPDFTCNTAGTSACTMDGWGDVAAETAAAGSSTIRAWIDDDQNNNTADADTSEGIDETTAGGAQTEPDDTDVVGKTWFAQFSADAQLECTPEDATNPSTGANSTETYTCSLFDNNNTVGDDTDDDPIAGITVDAEVLGTPDNANDPDNGTNTPTADFNNACTTDANGQCTINIPAGEAQAGTTDICFWADPDNDTQFVTGGGDPNDGGECNEGANTETANQTDVVTKTWVAPNTPQDLEASPDSDQNIHGTSHTVTATVTDINGSPVAGVPVDFEIVSGRNVGQGVVCDDITTNASGVATCTYTDDLAGQGPVAAGAFEEDEIFVEEQVNLNSETVFKFWFAADPTADEVIVDMFGCGDTGDNLANNTVGTVHEVCIQVENATNGPIPGETVEVTSDGVGTFVTDDVNESDLKDEGLQEEDDLGTEITVTTDSAGQAFVYLYSETAGDQLVTATADAESDTGTKRWFENRARNIDCSPNTATNQIGTDHTVTCVLTDLFGNPVSDAVVVADENGEGSVVDADTNCFTGADDCAITDQSGTAEFRTTASNAGTQTLTVEIRGDRGDVDGASDDDDECDQQPGSAQDPDNDVPPENVPYGSSDQDGDVRATEAGNCEETVNKTWSTTPPTPSGGFPRTVTLESSKNKLTYGNGFALTATVSAGSTDTPASCVQGVTVTFQREIVGTAGSEIVGTATTDANGEASLALSADRSANYVASVDQTAECSDATSSAEAVLVKKKVKLRVSDQTPRRGTRVRFVVKVLPCGGADGPGHEGDRVQLYKTVGGQLAKIAAKRTNDNCKAVFKRRARGSNTYQARSPKSDDDHLGGKSRKKAVQAHR